MINTYSILFELIQVSIGTRLTLSVCPTEEEWQWLFDQSQNQSIAGITYAGVQRLKTAPEGMTKNLPRALYLRWTGITMQTVTSNEKAMSVCHSLVALFKSKGFESCILKGQSNMSNYGALSQYRTTGDVDIWVKARVKDIIDYLDSNNLIVSLCYLHAETKPYDGVPVEVHFRPSFLNEHIRNRRLQRQLTFDSVVTDSENGLPVLSYEKNLVFQLSHVFRHFLDEGVGLRQVLDYYFLLKKYDLSGTGSDISRSRVTTDMQRVGLSGFASALMYVLVTTFAMPEDWAICSPDEKVGKVLLDEILQSGNFGKSDSRMKHIGKPSHKTSYQVQRAIRRIRRNSRFLRLYPMEVVMEPFSRIDHYIWRKLQLWNYGKSEI